MTKTQRNIKFILFCLILALSYQVISYRLDYHSIWYDEAVTFRIINQENCSDVIRESLQRRPYPPLYFLLTHAAYRCRPDTVGFRWVSAAAGALSVAALFLLASSLFGIPIGILAAFLLLLMPNFIFHARDANPYTLMILFTTLSSYFLWKALVREKLRHWAAFTVLAVLGMATHAITMMFTLGQMIIAFFFAKPWQMFSRQEARPAVRGWFVRQKYLLLSATILILSVGLWAWYFKTQTSWHTYYHDTGGPRPLTLFSIIEPYSGFIIYKNLQAFFRNPMMIGMFFFGLAACFLTDRKAAAFLTAHLLVPISCVILFLLLTYPTYVTRYSMSTAPFFALAVASSVRLGFVVPGGRGRILNAVRYALVAATLCLMAVHIAGYVTVMRFVWHHPGSEDWKRVARLLEHRVLPDDVILVRTANMVLPLEYYYKRNDPSPVPMTVEGTGPDDPAFKNFIFQHIMGKKRVWLVMSHVNWRDGFDKKMRSFKLRIYVDTEKRFVEVRLRQMAKMTFYSINVFLYNVVTKASQTLKVTRAKKQSQFSLDRSRDDRAGPRS